jgi:hypothetical protein
MAEHHEEPTEIQYLAGRLGEVFDDILLIDDSGDLIKTGDAVNDKQVDDAVAQLWAMHYGIRDYIPFAFPVDLKDCLILATLAVGYIEHMTVNQLDEDDAQRNEDLLRQTMARLITGLEGEAGAKIQDLGLRSFIPGNIDPQKKAVNVIHEIRRKQFEQAKEADPEEEGTT